MVSGIEMKSDPELAQVAETLEPPPVIANARVTAQTKRGQDGNDRRRDQELGQRVGMRAAMELSGTIHGGKNKSHEIPEDLFERNLKMMSSRYK